MKRIITLIIAMSCCLIGIKAQLTIEDCYALARQNYPLLKQYDLIERTKVYSLSNANKAYLPQLKLTGKASYQSDVTKIPIQLPGVDMPTLEKDQYAANINLEQLLWDGGATGAQKDMTRHKAEVDQKKLDVDMYGIRDRVNNLFLGIVLIDAQLDQLALYQNELNRNYAKVESYISNGLANQSDLDVVKVEQLKTEQKKSTLSLAKKSYQEILSIFTGEAIGDNTKLIRPNTDELAYSLDINSPELQLLAAQRNQLESQKSLLKSSYMPKFGLFAQAGYGRPSLNMLATKFDDYYIAGVNLSWNISSFYTKNNDSKLIQVSQEAIESQRETFLFNKKMELTQDQLAIEKQRKLLQQDDEIIQLRTNVKKASEIKLENGTITVNDLVRDVIEEDLAKQDKILHDIELLQAIYQLKYSTNN